jgi:hypothetical protein
MRVVLLVLTLLLLQVQAIRLRDHVPADISSRCKALALDIQTFPKELRKEQHARLSALHICKPEFKLWFWQSIDDKPLMQLEQSVAQSMQVIMRARQRDSAIRYAIASILLAMIISRKRTYIVNKWRLFRRNPYLCIFKPLYAAATEVYIFMQMLGVISWILSASYALLCATVFSRFLHYTWDSLVFFQAFVIVFLGMSSALYFFVVHVADGGAVFMVRMRNGDRVPFRNLLEEQEAQDLVKAVVPAGIFM